jgi:hypothetical protein
MRRKVIGVVVCAVLALAAGAAASSCKSSASPAGTCSINSDCNNPLVCAFGRCHSACLQARDCPAGDECVVSGTTGVCLSPAESTCSGGSACADTLVCVAGKCLGSCSSSGTGGACLAGQTCEPQSASVSACVDTGSTGDGGTTDGSNSGDTGAGANDGGSKDAGSNDSASAADGTGDACTSAQTQFGGVAQGDSNPSFTSGVGVRTATQLIVFDGYYGTDPVGDAGETGYMFVQAFDPVTGNSQGPATPIMAIPQATGDQIALQSAAVAPSGEILLLWQYYGTNYLLATFFSDPVDAGTGTAALQVQKTVTISVHYLSQPQVVWSPTSHSFVVSFVYYNSTGDYVMQVAKYLPNGDVAGGGTDPVPTDDPSAQVSSAFAGNPEAVVAGSNGLSGVAYLSYNLGPHPNTASLSVLDGQGNPVGSPFVMTGLGTTSGWVTLGGTNAGFVMFYDVLSGGGGVGEVLVPVSADGGVPAVQSGGVDAGALPGFRFTGTTSAVYARAANDDVGGAGGVGVGILYPSGVSFAYVNADGKTHVGPSPVLPVANGDAINVNNFGGSFGLSVYAGHSVQAVASGCQ